MHPTLEFSSAYGRVLTVATAVAGVAAVVATAAEQGGSSVVDALAWAALVVVLVWAVFWRPAVVVSDGEVVVRNVWRTTRVPWPTYRGVEAGLSLVVQHTEGTVTAWAAPSGSGTAARLRHARSRRALAERPVGLDRAAAVAAVGGDGGTVERPVRASGTAETVAAAVQDRHDALVAAGHLRDADRLLVGGDIRPIVTWHARTLGSVLILAVAVAVLAVT